MDSSLSQFETEKDNLQCIFDKATKPFFERVVNDDQKRVLYKIIEHNFMLYSRQHQIPAPKDELYPNKTCGGISEE